MTNTQKHSAVSFFQNKALLTHLSHQLQNLFTFTENYPKRGFSLGLSVQYLIEQRQQGSSGGQGYLSWLKLLTDNIHTRFLSIKPGITSTADTENLLRHQFRLLRLSEVLLNLHPDGITLNRIPVLPFQKNDILGSFSKAKRNFYEKHLQKNGLMMETPTGEEASPLKSSVKKTYADFMTSLRNPADNQYFLFFTTADTMAVTYQKTENGAFWSFFNPDEGAYLYDNYENFKNDMDEYFFNSPDSGHGFYDSQTKGRASIKYARLSEASTLSYDETWKHFNQKESLYVIDELIERKIRLPFNKYNSARLLDRTLNAEGHVVSIRVQLMNHPSSDEVKMIEVNSPFSSLKDLHAAFLDLLNPFGGDFKFAPDSQPSSDKTLENESRIFFDLQGEPYFEMELYEKELMLPKIREIYNQRLSLNEIDFPNLPFLTKKKIDTYYYSSGGFTLTELPYKRIELYEDAPLIHTSMRKILEDKIHPDHLNEKLQKYSDLNIRIADSDFYYLKSSPLFSVDDVCDADNRHQNSSSVKKMSLMIEPDTNNRALFDLGEGDDTAVGYQNKKNIFIVKNGIKKYTGGNLSDAFYLSGSVVSSAPSQFNGLEGEDVIIAEHPLTGTDYSGYSINLENKEVHYRSLDGTLTLVANLDSIEHAEGHQETQDHLTGNHENNQLDGRGGKDSLWGKDGDDTLILEQGQAHGGSGRDHYIILPNQQDHPVDINIYDTEEESSITFFEFENISFSLIKNEATDDQYDIKITLDSSLTHRTTHVFIKNAYHAKNQNTLELINGCYSFYTAKGLLLSPDWPETIKMDERGHFSFIPRFYAVYDPSKDQKHKAYFDSTPQGEIFISLEKREGHGDLITVGQDSVLLPKSIDLKLIDTRFNDRLIGNSHDNVITSSRGNDYIEGKAGRDIYYIEQPEKVGRTVLINNQDTATDPQDDLLILPVPLSQISDINVIEQDVVLSSRHEPDQNLSLRFQNFLRHKSYRHIKILDSKGHLFELNVNEQGKAYLDRSESRLYPAETNEQGQVYFSFSSPPDPDEKPKKPDPLVIHRRLTGNAQNNVITSSRGNEYLEGKGGRDVYYINKPDHQNKSRTVLINNKDTTTSPGYDLLVLPMRLIEMSDIQAIGKDIVLSSRHEPDNHLKIRFQNFLLDDSYRHINILDSAGDLFELKFDEKGPVYFGAASINPFPTEKADALVITRLSTQRVLDAKGGDDFILDNSRFPYTAYGAEGNDIIIALKGGRKTLYGNEGNDQIFSGADVDTLKGGQGNDFLSGGAGDDALWGGQGDDFLSGGEGDDTYHVSRLDGHTTIEDSDQKYKLRLTDIKYNELLLTVINKDIYITLRDPHFKDTFSIKLITKPTTPLFKDTYLFTLVENHNYDRYSLSHLVKDSICSFSSEEKEQLINRHKHPLSVDNMVQLAGINR